MIKNLFASTLLATFGLVCFAPTADAVTPHPRTLPATVAAKRVALTKTGLTIAEQPEKLAPLDDDYVLSIKIDSTVRFLSEDLVKEAIRRHEKKTGKKVDLTTEYVIIVEHPTSGADEDYQLVLDRDRALSVLTASCAKNEKNESRWVRILTEANNKVGYVRFIRPQKLVAMGGLAARLSKLEMDTDKDGIKDVDDKCIDIPAGPTPDPFHIGCPDKDTDKDGLTDHHGDHCVNDPGPKENFGCPIKAPVEPPKVEVVVNVPPTATTPPPAAEAPKAHSAPVKSGDKNAYFTIAGAVGTEITASTPGTVGFGINLGVCATGSSLNQEIKIGDRVVYKPWYICPSITVGAQARNYNRDLDAHHVRVELRFSALTGGRGLNAAGTAPRDNMRANGAFLGPMIEGLVTEALLKDNKFLAVYGALAGAEFMGRLGVFTIGIHVAPVGVCSVSKPGYTAGVLGQAKAEYCVDAGVKIGVTF